MKKKDRIRILESQVADLRRRLEQQQLEINTLKWPQSQPCTCPGYPGANPWIIGDPYPISPTIWCQTSNDNTAPAARSDA